MALSGRLVILLAVGVVPVIAFGRTVGDASLTLLLWVLGCAVVCALDLLFAASPQRLLVRRELPPRVRLGEEATTVLLVANQGGRMLRARIRDAWQPSAGAPSERIRLDIPAGERRSATTVLRPTRRGERAVETVTVRSFGPLGLAARQATLPAPGRLRVLPPFLSRRHLPSRLARLHELDGRTAVMVRGQGTEFDSLREYVRGDDVRSLDWRATARRGSLTSPDPRLMVRTWRPERDRRIVLVLDTSRTSAARIEDEPRLDTAIEAALLLSAVADRAGDRVDLLAWDRVPRARVHGASGAALLSREVDALASVEPRLIEMDWTGVPAQVRALTAQRALVVLLTSLDTIGAAQGLLSALPQLVARHTVLIASVTDPAVLAAATRRADRGEVYRAAAAECALLDTDRIAAAVRQLGAHVVTGSPTQLPPAVTDAYLALKAAGRL